MSRAAGEIVVRRARTEEAAAVADVCRAAFHATDSFPPAHPDDDVRAWIADVVERRETWVAVDGERVVGMAVVGADDLDQLDVAPDRRGEGIGRRLLERAKERSPGGPTLHTFQERQPDVRYVWRPDGA